MDFVTLVNRSTKTLHGTWDGRHYDIAPGNHAFPEIQAMKFREQNPVMGSENPYTGQKQYLMGIVEQGDDTAPIEQSSAISLQDLSAKLKSGELKIVPGEGLYRPMMDASLPMGTDLAFVKP